MTIRILFLGGGNMATAIIEGLLRQGTPATSLFVLELAEAARQRFVQMGVGCAEQLPAEFKPDLAVLAVKPQQMQAALEPLASALKDSLVLSIAAGLPIDLLSNWLNGHTRIVRSMPNTPAMVGMGITGVYAAPACTQADRDQAHALLSACGQVIWVDSEAKLNPVTAISGSGPGYVFLWMEALQSAAVELGFTPDQARALVTQTVRGAAELASQSDEAFARLREKVTSKGGTTAAGLEVMTAGDVPGRIAAGALAANARAVELGEMLKGG